MPHPHPSRDAKATTNAPEALISFCNLLNGNRDLQSQVKAAQTPQEIINIAGSTGHQISWEELRTWSRELSSDCFPWATMGHEWRRNFFKRKE